MRTYRIIQWATGGLGRAAIEGVASHPELELVGCWVHSPAKAGRDAGEIAGIGRLGVTATTDVDALLALDADCAHAGERAPGAARPPRDDGHRGVRAAGPGGRSAE